MRIAPVALAIALIAASCGNVTDAQPPSLAPGRIAAGGDFTCVVVSDGGVACWGDRAYMGAGFTRGDAAVGISAPVAVSLPEGMRFTQVTASRDQWFESHACALADDGTAWCWGASQFGQLGNSSDCCGDTPAAVTMPRDTVFSQISAGDQHACAVAKAGSVWCWGDGQYGQLGDVSATAGEWERGGWHVAEAPARVVLPDGVEISEVASGGDFTCALAIGGAIWCWGHDSSGRRPKGPVAMSMPGTEQVRDIASTTWGMCGVTSVGAAWCWDLTSGPRRNILGASSPEAVAMPDGATFTLIAGGAGHFCALSADGAVWCWGGRGGYGVGLPIGTLALADDSAAAPVDLSSPSGRRFTDIAAGGGHTCAIATDSTVWCWGSNIFGQLGDESGESSLTPVEAAIDLAAPAPPSVPTAPLSLEPVVVPPYSDAAFLSPPPLWTLDVERSRRIYGLFLGGDRRTPERWGVPDRCLPRESESPGEECIYAYFASAGVSLAALSLLKDYGLSVLRIAGAGPVWVAETYDWEYFETNVDGAYPNVIFTPEGIISVMNFGGSDAVDDQEARTAALSSDLDERIAAAEAEAWGPSYGNGYLGSYPEEYVVPVVAPTRTEDGWSIPYRVQLGSGAHCCPYPFYARFVLDLDADGTLTGVRFAEWCYVDEVPFYDYGEPLPDMSAIEEIGASLPMCSTD